MASLTNGWAAISVFDRPAPMSPSTSASRGVRPYRWHASPLPSWAYFAGRILATMAITAAAGLILVLVRSYG